MSNYHRFEVRDEAGPVAKMDEGWNRGGPGLCAMLNAALAHEFVVFEAWDPIQFQAYCFLMEHRARLKRIAVVDEYGETVQQPVDERFRRENAEGGK